MFSSPLSAIYIQTNLLYNYSIQAPIQHAKNWFTRRQLTLDEARILYEIVLSMESGLDRITDGHGREWINKNLGGAKVVIGNFLGSSFVTGKTVYLRKNFEHSGWSSLNGKYDTMIIHEFGHVLDNASKHSLFDADIFGGGAGDQLMAFVHAHSSGPFGIRAMGKVVYEKNAFPAGYEVPYPSSGTPSYGNNSTADYFANTFAAVVVDYKEVPQPSGMWMTTYIIIAAR
jgi:hypothetical protein